MRTCVLSFCFYALLGHAAFAESFQLPEQKPVVSFDLPDSWKPSQTDAGLEAASVDGEIYLSIEYIDVDSVNDVIDGAISFLDKQGVKVDKTPKSEGNSTVNDMPISHTSYNGTDKDGPCEVSLSFITVAPGKGLMITYWGSQEAANKHQESLVKIIDSIKKI
jgi:hypothetical protein